MKSSQSRFREQEVVEVEREDGYWAKARVVEVVGNDQWKVRIDGSRSDEAELFASDRIRSIRFSIVGNESEGYSPGSRFLFSVPDQRMNGYQIDEWKTALNDSDSQKFPERLAQLESHEHPGYFYVPPSGRWLGMATGGMFRIWDLRTAEESLRLPQFVSNVSYGMCWCAATNADETVLVTARTHTMDNQLGKVPPSICFWDLQTGEKVHEIPLNYHRMDVDELAISTDGRWLAVRMEDERAKAYSYIQWYDMKTMELIETSLLHAGEQEGWYTLKFSPQESWLTPQSMKFVNDKTLMFLAQSLNARSGNRSVYHARLGTRRADLVHVIPGTGKILSLDVSREKGIYAIADHDEDLDDYAVKIVICDLNDHAELHVRSSL
ncbi:MAG: hypothetical protein R3C02_21705 [Planctomycetaceae bacterium]